MHIGETLRLYCKRAHFVRVYNQHGWFVIPAAVVVNTTTTATTNLVNGLECSIN